MLARLARELPRGDWVYEPKWDGFRCIAEATADGVDLRSRHGRPLARYFPEVAGAIAQLATAARVVLDGEIVIQRSSGFDFAALLARTHPSPSRVARLAAETPASFIAFDLLAVGDEELAPAPLEARRARLERLLARSPRGVLLTPATREIAVAQRWLERYDGGGVDGVVAKALDSAYLPGKRGWVKVKRRGTADCVVAGLRLFSTDDAVASLLLGLWDGPALLHVGVVSSFTEAQRTALRDELRPLVTRLAGHPWQHGFGLDPSPVGRLAGSAGRWDPRSMDLDWTPLRPLRVCEVAYGQLDGRRFRHPAQFVRWRPDRDPGSCGFDQLELAATPIVSG